ncbi:hypothetical protein LUZ60_016590 [Juncus effusus]|nr:hypothetical protein LUZ60_016590 [Juncus effusus]
MLLQLHFKPSSSDIQLNFTENHILDIDSIPSPRLLATHVPFGTLPESVLNSGCKIVYLCRNPKDTFVSLCHFSNKVRENFKLELVSINTSLDYFCNGISQFGPYWDHVLGYWRAHLHRPDQVMFLTYEELKENPVSNVMKIAEFVGYGFSEEEVKNGVCEHIVKLCGFENLIESDATKNGKTKIMNGSIDNNLFFRR